MHKVFAAVSITTRFLRRGASPLQATLFLLPYHLLPPVSVILAALVGSEDALASLVLSGLAAGTFLYIGAFEVVCEEFVEAEAAAAAADDDGGDGGTGAGDEKAVAKARGWQPSKGARFAAFAFGAAVLLALTAALPESEHNH